jgi:thiamine-phosphate pyrophosphorylase
MRLYVIPDGRVGAPLSLEEQTDRALQGGATMIQLRDKQMTDRELYETACRMRRLCAARRVPFVVNDRLDVALAAEADGVHLGLGDIPVARARRVAPRGFIVGGTAHSEEEAIRAERDGADYIGIGAAYASGSKKDSVVLGPEGIARVRSSVSIPTVAIGGITAETAKEVLASGVDGICVIEAAVGRGDVEAAVRRLLMQ